ncbi:MAG: hypothetical protein ACLRT5_07660 [Lachnospiraceae bacterium]
MKNETTDIYEMLDTLSLPVAAQRFVELSESPELGSYTALQFIREVLEPQYIETLNKRFETNLRLSDSDQQRSGSREPENRQRTHL